MVKDKHWYSSWNGKSSCCIETWGVDYAFLEASGKIFLPKFGNIEIKLKPLEKTIYRFYLEHPEGVRFSDLRDHQEALSKYYMNYINDDDGDREYVKRVIDERIEKLVNITNNSPAEKFQK